MKGITYLELKTSLKQIQKLLQLEITQEINQHATFVLTGVLHEESKDSCVTDVLEGKEIEIYANRTEKTILFKGLVQKARVQFVGGMYTLELKGISYSVQMDLKKKSVSYQDIGETYETIVETIGRAYPKGAVKDFASNKKPTRQLLVQYQETDWEFLKRLASHFNMGIIPNVTLEGPKIMFGTYQGVHRGEAERFEYSVGKDLLSYRRSNENTNPSLKESDILTYYIKVFDNFDLGDQVSYQGKSLFVKSKKAVLVQGMLWFHYALCAKNGLGTDKIYNETLTGVSLKGKVLQSIQDRVKVHLEIDESQDAKKAFEFPYSTIYTAEGQSGWYCMPEEGDTVLVNFPSHEEGGALAIDSYRMGENSSAQLDDTSIKYFRTANGKELKFSKEEIVITCIQGQDPVTKENKTVSIRLNQNNGIEIISSEPIQFTTDKGITLQAEEKIEITAKESIQLRCKRSQIRMDSKVDICGPDVRIN